MLNALRNSFARSLRFRALTGVILAVGLTMGASTLYHLHSAWNEAQTELNERAQRAAGILAEALSRPLFDFNHTAVASAVEALGATPDLVAIRVRDPAGQPVAMTGDWPRQPADTIEVSREVIHREGDLTTPVGRIDIRVSSGELRQDMRRDLIHTVVANAVLGLAIILFLLFLSRRTSRHFMAVVDALDKLRAGDLSIDIAGTDRKDEIGQLAKAVESFRVAIEQREASEKALQSILRERERNTQEALDRSEEQYRLVVENASEGIMVVQNERVVLANPRLELITGHSKEELASGPFANFIHPDDRDLVIGRHRRRLAGENVEAHYEFRIRNKEGETRWVELSAVMFHWHGQPATLSFITDITHRKQAEEEIRSALEKQKELNDLKSRFVSMTSHEFRTPLATILSSSELLKYYSDRLPPEEKASLIDSIESAVKRMTQMLDSVLTIGRADAGMLEFAPAPMDVAGFCRKLADETARAVPGEGNSERLHFTASGNLSRVMDEKLLRHILGNLLTNAFKYSPAGGQVEFHAGAEDQHIVFTVRDHGIGIPAEDLPSLFESFHRAGNVGNIAGTGLGMAIVRRATDLHGGTITVDSEVGKGTSFRVELPAPASAH